MVNLYILVYFIIIILLKNSYSYDNYNYNLSSNLDVQNWRLDNEVVNFTFNHCRDANLDLYRCKLLFQDKIIDYINQSKFIDSNIIASKYLKFADLFVEKKSFPYSTNSLINSERNFYGKNLSSVKLLILSSHYEEDLSWLLNQNLPPFIIASKILKGRNINIDFNLGNEASSYLQYIIEYYYNLPERTLFLHGHNTDWHQIYPIEFIVKSADQNSEYYNINNYLLNDRKIESNRYFKTLYEIWDDVFREELGDFPYDIYELCCAQFIVHRNRILSRPRNFYIKLFNFIKYHDFESHDPYHSTMSFVIEFIWHIIFQEPANRMSKIYSEWKVVLKIDNNMQILF